MSTPSPETENLKIRRMLELSKILDKDDTKAIDGWGAYALLENGSVLAGKRDRKTGLSMSKIFPPEGEWKRVAEFEKVREEYQKLFRELSKEEWQEFQRLEKQSKEDG
jgi:hypothetical protein